MEMTPALESFSFLFYHSLLFSRCRTPLLHPTRASCLTRHTCFLSTACFNLRSAGFASEATRIEAVKGECSRGRG